MYEYVMTLQGDSVRQTIRLLRANQFIDHCCFLECDAVQFGREVTKVR